MTGDFYTPAFGRLSTDIRPYFVLPYVSGGNASGSGGNNEAESHTLRGLPYPKKQRSKPTNPQNSNEPSEAIVPAENCTESPRGIGCSSSLNNQTDDNASEVTSFFPNTVIDTLCEEDEERIQELISAREEDQRIVQEKENADITNKLNKVNMLEPKDRPRLFTLGVVKLNRNTVRPPSTYVQGPAHIPIENSCCILCCNYCCYTVFRTFQNHEDKQHLAAAQGSLDANRVPFHPNIILEEPTTGNGFGAFKDFTLEDTERQNSGVSEPEPPVEATVAFNINENERYVIYSTGPPKLQYTAGLLPQFDEIYTSKA